MVIGLVIAGSVAFGVLNFGRTWRIQWDTESGRERTVHYFLGIPKAEAPRETRLSEWKTEKSGTPNWVSVAKKPSPGLLVQGCSFSLLHKDLGIIDLWISLSGVDGGLDTQAARDLVASSILKALREGHGICEVQREVRVSAVFDDDRDCMEAPLSLAELRTIFPDQWKGVEINPRPPLAGS